MKSVALSPVTDHVIVGAAPLSAATELPLIEADRRLAASLPAGRSAEFLAARGLLRMLLFEVVGRPAFSPVAYRDSGKPYLPAHPHVGVSVSHSGGWAAAAVHPGGSVGVDVQAPRPVGDAMILRCCGTSVGATIGQLPEPRRQLEFAWIWSVQEACVKDAGSGISGRPWTIPVEANARHGRWQDAEWSALRDQSSVPLSCAYSCDKRTRR